MKNLIREIHRRSLWQVLGIYLAVSWIVLQVVDVIGSNFGLPDWVAPAALILLLLGLPVVIGTAFIQEGLGSKEFSPPPQSLADAGEVTPPPAPEPETHHRLFTWRNALIGGGVAFAVLGLLTAGYLVMRSAGIGPAGTLVAQGLLEDGASVVLADFQSDDQQLAEVVTEALRIDLIQSPTIALVDQGDVAGALGRMRYDAQEPLTGDVVRELAIREGYGAAIEGEIGPLGSGYVITARVLGGDAWSSLAAFRETARSEDDLIDAIESLSRKIRDKSGESLRSVSNSPPLARVSTSSLEALRAYARGEAIGDSDQPASLALFEQAVDIDPEFAMAHRKIAVTLSNLGIRRLDEVAAARRAFGLRDRLPPAESLLSEAYYYSTVGDRSGTIRAYERVLEHDPENIAALVNQANLLRALGRFDEAEQLSERGVSVRPVRQVYRNLAWSRLGQGRYEDAEAAWEAGSAELPETAYVFDTDRIWAALAAERLGEAEDLVAAFAERYRTPVMVGRNGYDRALVVGVGGRLDEAREGLRDAESGGAFFSHPMWLARDRAALLLVAGDSAGAVSAIVDAHDAVLDTLPAADRLYDWWLPLLFEAGGLPEAERLNTLWEQEVSSDELDIDARDARREIQAWLAFAEGDFDEAIRLWEAFERECPGACAVVAAVHSARALEAMGDIGRSIDEYERYLELEHPYFRSAYDLIHRGPVLERLGQLYEQRGDPTTAVVYHQRFVDLWADADPVLQPRVEAARARLTALQGAG